MTVYGIHITGSKSLTCDSGFASAARNNGFVPGARMSRTRVLRFASSGITNVPGEDDRTGHPHLPFCDSRFDAGERHFVRCIEDEDQERQDKIPEGSVPNVISFSLRTSMAIFEAETPTAGSVPPSKYPVVKCFTVLVFPMSASLIIGTLNFVAALGFLNKEIRMCYPLPIEVPPVGRAFK